MADDDDASNNKPSNTSQRPQETFHRAQEIQTEHRFPNGATGIIQVPPGSRGPKSLYLKRAGKSFGFTLRHFIVYPPDSVADNDGRHAAVGALSAPMDTIFVKRVEPGSPAHVAGLQCGDRLVGVNRVPVNGKSYAEVVDLIKNSPPYLHLLVVPKEDDILQTYFADTAYNPASNQHQFPTDIESAQHFLTQTFQHPREFQVDAVSWKSLQNSYGYDYYGNRAAAIHPRAQRSAENLIDRPRDLSSYGFQEIYYEQNRRPRARAQPQAPPYRSMGRRASDGCALSDRDYFYESSVSSDYEDMVVNNNNKMKAAIYKNSGTEMGTLKYPNSAGCRLSVDAGRRESSSSLASSLADGSKDSLSSYDSTATLTGHETDDSAILSRYRKSFQQKEEFLKMPTEAAVIPREFYVKPKKLEKQFWPPGEGHESPSKNTKPTLHSFQRVKNDIEVERDLLAQNLMQQKSAKSPKSKNSMGNSEIIREAATAPSSLDYQEQLNGATTLDYEGYGDNVKNNDKRSYPVNLQMVYTRTKQFESGKPLPEDDPILGNRTSFYRSELARLSSKKVVPNVTERAQEFETLSSDSKKDVTSPTAKLQRDIRSLESSDTPENQANHLRARSNSAESWEAALLQQHKKKSEPGSGKKISRQDALDDGNKTKVMGEDKPIVVKRRTKNTNLEDDRIMRRESYLKATEGGRMHFDGDLSDGDISPQVLRSGSVSGNSSSSASLEREKSNASPLLDKEKHSIIKEGPLHCKITEIDGKRFGDRSWKQVWALLRGPKLFLHKDKHHQSPMGTSDTVEHSLASGVDMRASKVRVAEDYTKRKHVLRVSSENPCRSEFLLQAENTEELADWVKALQEQIVTTTGVEAKLDPLNNSKQQAVPQTVPASISIQVQGSRLSPQPAKSKSLTSRNRSPTGQSPVSKTRKPSQASGEPATSPKSKTWRGRVAKQFRRMQGASSPSSPTAPEGSTFGVPLDQCLSSPSNPYVPKFVEVCTDIVDSRGLETVGIYRVPGNNASITAMTEEINRNYDDVPLDDPKWNDLHVVSSLLKSYFRKIPDSLVTNVLYPSFIKADKIEDPELRMKELKRLIKSLPAHNYHTLKHLIFHLKKVVDHSHVNKMEAKNLAIVFGPNIIRTDNMENMVNNMTHQCKIVETLLTCADWFFSESESDSVPVPAVIPDPQEESESNINQALLLDNISKYEALKDKEKNGALFTSIISAAQRKVKRKATKVGGSLNESKEEVASPTSSASYPSSPFLLDLKDSTTPDGKTSVIPTTVTEIEKNKRPEKVPWFNYSTDQEDFHRRIENFEQETKAMLQMPRNLEISVNNMASKQQNLSSSASNVNQSTRLSSSSKSTDSQLLKTHSASNVFSRTINADNSRNSLVDNNSYTVQYAKKNNSDTKNSELRYSNEQQQYEHDSNRNIHNSRVNNTSGAFSVSNKNVPNDADLRNGRFNIRRGSSVENIHSSSMDLNANGTMKKIKYENEEYSQRVGSLDSLNKTVPALDDDSDLVTSLTKIYDKKLQEKKHSDEVDALSVENLPYADASPEKSTQNAIELSDKENLPDLSDCYRNPSLHKNNSTKMNTQDKELIKNDAEKDEDSTMSLPERQVSSKLTLISTNKLNSSSTKLKRSESLNKPERTVSPLNIKLKRSESLNKTGDRLKRSDSLTKNEKTESNLNKRRELSTSVRRSKDVTKLKRKNGMPDRSIKRRHTVGGTKDPDKVTWLDNKCQEEVSSNKENREKSLRTSSPDLSSVRRERQFIEINYLGGDMMMALKQHLMGARPQSFPDTAVFNLPLESHV